MPAAVRELWRYRSLLGILTQRELTLKYRRSLLGWFWTLLNPAITLLVYTAVFGAFLRVEPPPAGTEGLRSFPLFLFSGLVVWNLFSNLVTGSMQWLLETGPLLKKASFPAEAPIVAGAGVILVQGVAEMLLLTLILAVLGNVSFVGLLAPFVMVLALCLSIGVAFLVSLVNVYFRDTSHLVKLFVTVLFYACPIVYPLTVVPERAYGWIPARALILANPLTQLVEALRDVLYRLEMPSVGRLSYITASCLGALLVGWATFRQMADRLSEDL